MKTLHVALALGLFSAALPVVTACGDDGEATTNGAGGSASGSGGEDAGSGGETSSPSSSSTSSSSPQGSGTSTASTASGEGGSGDGGAGAGGEGVGGSSGCRDPLPADRDRYVVVGHMFNGTDWEVLRLSQSGTLTRTEIHFQMGVAADARIAFTPDGEIGVAVQNDGSIGIFSIDEGGQVTVIDDAFGLGEFYANNVNVSPDGSRVIVGDSNTSNNGGGLYEVALDCETGAPTLVGLVAEGNNAWEVLDLGGGRWAFGGQNALGAIDGTDVTDIREGDPWTRAGGADPFPYDGAQVGAFAVDAGGSFLLVGDYSSFGDEPNNLAFMSVGADGFTPNADVIELDSPYAASIAPEGDVALVVSYFGDAIYVIDVDADAASPISYRGELAYQGSGTLLPGKLTTVDRGPLTGMTLVAELYGVRVVSYDGGGVVTDHGVTITGAETEKDATTPTGIGIQP